VAYNRENKMMCRTSRSSTGKVTGALSTPRAMAPVGIFGIAFALLAWHASAGAVTVSDDTFVNGNWSLTQFSSGSGGTVAAAQSATGGNPGAFRITTDTLTGGGVVSAVLGASIYAPFVYTPTVSGGIGSISYSEDAACTSGCFGSGQSTGPALLQNGKFYILSSSTVITGPATTFASHALSGLTALDFGLVSVVGGAIVDATQHPDFSATASPIQVGYFRANGTGPGGGGYTLAAGIDNWQITITSAAAPPVTTFAPIPVTGPAGTALLILALAALGALYARRRR
jgi:hypothetical protein